MHDDPNDIENINNMNLNDDHEQNKYFRVNAWNDVPLRDNVSSNHLLKIVNKFTIIFRDIEELLIHYLDR